MIVIPAVDLRRGRCVRLRQGDPDRERVFDEDPVAAAERWESEGAPFLHVVDLDGAFEGEPKQLAVVERIVDRLAIPVQLGGGLRTEEQIRRALETGVRRVIVGTAALADSAFLERLAATFGDRLCIGIDARDGRVAVRGWRETTSVRVEELARTADRAGVRRLIVTDIATDGMLSGPNLRGLSAVGRVFKGALIASGGVSDAADVRAVAALDGGRIEGVVVGRALYEGTLRLAEVPEFLVRPEEEAP